MSEIINSAVIKVEIDAAGVEVGLRKIDEGAAKTGKSLENLGRSDGLSNLGVGADSAATQFTGGAKKIAAAIERQMATMELGKRGTVEFYTALANQKGVDPAVLKPFLDQLDAVTRKTAEASAAQRKLDDGAKFIESLRTQSAEIGKSASELAALRAEQLGVSEAAAPMIARLQESEQAAGGLGSALGITSGALAAFAASIAAAFSVGAIVSGVSDAIDALADLDDIAQKTGSSVESLSRLQKVAQVVGQDFGAVDAAISKLAKGMGGLDEDSNKVISALSRLGISTKDIAKQDPSAVFIKAADSLQGYADGARKTALINDLLGKSGADLLPYLNDVSEKIGDFSGASAQATADAAEFQNGLGVLRVKADEFYTSIATMVLPALTDLVGAFGDAAKTQDDMFDSSSASWADELALGLAIVADKALLTARTISALSGSFKAVAADVKYAGAVSSVGNPLTNPGKFLSGEAAREIKQAADERSKVLEEANAKWDKLLNAPVDQLEQSMLKRIAARTSTFKDAFGDAFMSAAESYGKKDLKAGGGDSGSKDRAAAISKEAEAYRSLTESINERISATSREASGLEPLTESQKLQESLSAKLASGQLVLTAVHKTRYQQQIQELSVLESIAASRARAVKGGEDYAKFMKEQSEIAEKSIADLAKEADRNEDLARTFGMSKAEIEKLTLARLEDQLAQRASNALTLDQISYLEREIVERKRSAAALGVIDSKATADKVNKELVADWKKTVEKYDDIFRNGFADMLNNGKDGWKSFTKSLTTTFKTTVADQIYKMFAQPFVMKLVASLIGATGGGSIAGAVQAAGIPGAGPGNTGILGIAASAKQAYAAITTGFQGISTSVSSGVATGLKAVGVSPGTASSFGSMASTAAGYAGGASAGIYGGRAISNGYSAVGNSGNTLVNAGTIVGAIFAGPLGAAIGGLLGGAANRLFGRKAKEFGDTTLNGSFGADGFAGTSDTSFVQKGGVFRSDKRGTDKVGVDATTAAQFASGYEAIKVASADFAKTLGLNANALEGRAQSLSIKLGKDQAENEAAVAKFFTNVADTIASEILPNLSAFAVKGEAASATLQRIAGNYAFVDVALEAIGKTFGTIGIGSVAARERLVALSGGIESLGKGTAFFAQNFLSEAERLAPVAVKLKASLADMGLAFVDTRDEFKSIVLGLDLTTESGASTYAGLMKIQEAFAQIYPAAEAASNALSERIELQKEYDDLTLTAAQQLAKTRAALDISNRGIFDQVQAAKAAKAAQDAMRTSLGDVISKMRSFGESARALGDGLKLGDLSTLTPEQQYGEAKRQYESTLVAAKGGDANAQGNFSSIATAFLEASQRINGGDASYSADFTGVLSTADEIAKWSAGQVDVAQASLDALNAQVSALGQLNLTMGVVATALTPGTETLVNTVPRLGGQPNYAAMGTLDMAPMAAELKLVREQLRIQTEKSDQHTAALIESNMQVTMLAARLGVDGAVTAATNMAWERKNVDAEVLE